MLTDFALQSSSLSVYTSHRMATLAGLCLAVLLGLYLTVLSSESTPDLKDERGKASVNNKGILVDVIRQPEKGTERGLEASYIRGKRKF